MKKFNTNWVRLIAFCFVLAVIYGCSKELDESISPSRNLVQTERIGRLKKNFLDQKYDSTLFDKFNDSLKIYWEPAWQEAFEKTSPNSDMYTYVPLEPQLRSVKTGRIYEDFEMIYIERYIVIKQVGPNYSFQLATYSSDDRGTNADMENASLGKFNVSNDFTGSLFLKDLTHNSVGIINYSNGKREEANIDGLTGNSVQSTSGWDCLNIYTCYWSYPCGQTVVGTSTRTVGGQCSDVEPTQEPCSWAMGWRLEGSYYEGQQCTYVEDPPLPGGGVDGSATLPCPGDVIYTPKIAPSSSKNINGGRWGDTRQYPNGSPKSHKGLDINVEVNTPLYSMYAGKVIGIRNTFPVGKAGYKVNSLGNYVIVQTTLPNGEVIQIKYAHLNRVDVNVNDIIAQKKQIGLSGRTGNAWKGYSPHVHIIVLKNGININPEPYSSTKFDATGTPINNPC